MGWVNVRQNMYNIDMAETRYKKIVLNVADHEGFRETKTDNNKQKKCKN